MSFFDKYAKEGIVAPTTPMAVRDHIIEYYKTNEWFIIIAPVVQAIDIGIIIEEKFYDPKDPEKNKDYELTLFEHEAMAFMFCKKSRMSAKDLRDSLKLVAHARPDLIDQINDDQRIIVYSSQKDFLPTDPKLVMLHRVGEANCVSWALSLFKYIVSENIK